MNAFLATILFAAAAVSGCPEMAPVECMPEDMVCPGGLDWEGCPMPDMCMPSKGPMGYDGIECPAYCPTNCGPEDQWCYGGMDANGCEMPATCMPMKGEYTLAYYLDNCKCIALLMKIRTYWQGRYGLSSNVPNDLCARRYGVPRRYGLEWMPKPRHLPPIQRTHGI